PSSISPRSSLLPYTTLFRSSPWYALRPTTSVSVMRSGPCPRPIGVGHSRGRSLELVHRVGARRQVAIDQERETAEIDEQGHGEPDRKSTRLNSSHGSISYAV